MASAYVRDSTRLPLPAQVLRDPYQVVHQGLWIGEDPGVEALVEVSKRRVALAVDRRVGVVDVAAAV